MITRKKFILIDVNTVQRYFLFNQETEERVRMCGRFLHKIRRIFAWTRLTRTPVISIMPEPTPKRICKKLGHSCRTDCKVVEAMDTTDRPQPHDQLIFYNRYPNPFEEPQIDRVLTDLETQKTTDILEITHDIVIIGIGKELTNTVIGLLLRRKQVTVLQDMVRFPGSSTAEVKTELIKMEEKGARMITLKEFGIERSQRWQRKESSQTKMVTCV